MNIRIRDFAMRFVATLIALSAVVAPVAPAFAVADIAPPAPEAPADFPAVAPAPSDTAPSASVPASPAATGNPFALSPALTAPGAVQKDTPAKQNVPTDKQPQKKTSGTMSLMSGSESPPPPYHDPRHTARVNIKADEATGALTAVFPVRTPPGRLGVEPALSLSYSSRNRDNAGIAGYGWSIDIPRIERINRRGSNRLFTEYDFRSSFDDELGRTESATSTEDYGAKTETGAYRRYQFVDHAWWRMTDKRGWTYTFGTTTASQITSSTSVFRWMLEKAEDTNGNSVVYEYEKDAGQIYPLRITYTRSAGDTGLFEVAFAKESRVDIATSSAYGFPVASRYRISEIQVKAGGVWVRTYALGYTTGDAGARSLLASITETGRDESTGDTITLPPTQFAYQRSAGAWTYTDHNFDLGNLEVFSYRDSSGYTRDNGSRFGDANGDGLPDIFHNGTLFLHTGTSSWTTDHHYDLGNLPLLLITSTVTMARAYLMSTATDWTTSSGLSIQAESGRRTRCISTKATARGGRATTPTT